MQPEGAFTEPGRPTVSSWSWDLPTHVDVPDALLDVGVDCGWCQTRFRLLPG